MQEQIIEALNFFVYDSVKIILLLFVMIFLIGIVRTYISTEKLRKYLSRKGIIGNFFASLFGAITPFCSCSSIPIFLGFLEAQIPLGVSLSFLITSPIINEYLVVLMFGFFGVKIATLYVLFGLLIGTSTGFILGKMGLEKELVKNLISQKFTKQIMYKKFKERVKFGISEATSIVKKIWLWVVFGVFLGALIHNFVPQDFIQATISKTGIFMVPLAVILGVPMYGSCAAIVPIAVALFDKGIPLGTALAFMMAVSALSLPEAIILRRAMKLKLIAIYFGVVSLAIIIVGYAFNIIQAFI